ncbi:MAG: tetratricopeptide repeat protein [Pyrinomonadaceae bacterium]
MAGPLTLLILTQGVVFGAVSIANEKAISSAEWKADIAELVRLLEDNHPNPYTRISRQKFNSQRQAIERDLDRLTQPEIVVRLMNLVSSIRDGHTVLYPSGKVEFRKWFPISFYKFGDGIYVVAAEGQYRDLIGTRVTRIGETDAESAFERTADMLGSDNEFGRSWNTFYLSSGDTLAAIGVIKNAEKLPIVVQGRDGRRSETVVTANDLPFSLEHRFWGEMYPPGSDKAADHVFVAFDNQRSLLEWRRNEPKELVNLPLHLRSRRAYWYQYLPDKRTMYVHLTHVTDGGRGEFKSFAEFYDHVFKVAEENKVEKFILDIRYNSGGDGTVLIPFVHKFIKSPLFEQPGRLFTITGRKTYSAGVMLYDLMLTHTNTVLVGEPAGAARNSYGDAGTFVLPNSRLRVDISTVHWQLTNSADKSLFQPVDIPAVFTAGDYFEGRDPAVDQILALQGRYESLPEILRAKGGQAAKKEYAERRSRNGRYTWWKAFDEGPMRFAARDLMSGGKAADGKAGFEILLDQYPESWRAWRDYGNSLLSLGEKQEALRCYKRGLAINPGYEEFSKRIRELEGE